MILKPNVNFYPKVYFHFAGYQEETFIGDKNKLAKLFGIFAYILGLTTFLLPFGLEVFGDIAGITYAICICGSVIVILIWKQFINKPY